MIHHMVAVSREKAISLGIKTFVKSSACKNGHYSYFLVCNYTCIECAKRTGKKSRFKDIEKTREKDRNRYNSMPEDKKAERNKKLYAASDKEAARKRSDKWKADNKEAAARHIRTYKDKHKKKIREYEKNRRKTDPDFRCMCQCRAMLRRTLEYSGQNKHLATFKALGYTNIELRMHLEKQFTKGMSWEKMGSEIEIDHIYPLSRMIKEGIKDPAIINALSNLMPRWSCENREKGDKVESLL